MAFVPLGFRSAVFRTTILGVAFQVSALGLRVVGSLSSGFASHPEPNRDTFEYLVVGSIISSIPNCFVWTLWTSIFWALSCGFCG